MPKQQRMRNPGYKGIYYIEAADGQKIYYIVYRRDGRLIEEKCGKSRTDSMTFAKANQIRSRRIDGAELSNTEEREKAKVEKKEELRRGATVGSVWKIYLEDRWSRWSERHYADHVDVAKPGGQKTKRGKGKIKPGPLASLMPLKLSDLTPEKVEKWAKKEVAKRATRTRLAFSLLRAFINWTAEHPDYSGLVSPTVCSTRVKKEVIPRGKAKDDCLQREQLPAWFKAVRGLANPTMAAYLQTLLLIGARRNELAALEWDDIDFKWQTITIRDKVEGERAIPLTPYVATLLEPLPRRNKFVFASPTSKSGRIEEPRHIHNKALAVAGIEGLTLHGLRRSFGTLSEWVEVPVGVVAQLMGHKPSAIAERHYRRRPLDLLRMWHEKIEAWILEQAGIEQPAAGEAGLRVVK